MAEITDALRPYLFHGMDLDIGPDQAIGDCPFCGKEGKFYINISKGLWDCKTCSGEGGNLYTFIRQLWEVSDRETDDYEELKTHRDLLYPETFMEWGCVRSVIDGTWMIPAYSPDRKLIQLYRYQRDSRTKKTLLLATPTLAHGLFGVPLYSEEKKEVYILEGPWDAMAAYEVLKRLKVRPEETGKNKLVPTGSVESSLLSYINVLATPGCNVFAEPWCRLLNGKYLTICYDNDHPRGEKESGGLPGIKRILKVLINSGEYPEVINYLRWGKEEYHDPELPNGTDVRDVLRKGKDLRGRGEQLNNLFDKIQVIPKDWVPGKAKAKGTVEQEMVPCSSWRKLQMSWKKAMKWTPGLDRGLATMLAAAVSTRVPGDQLWLKVIGPASCGKSTLCEALSVNRKYVLAKSVIRGFHSGFKSEGGEGEDNSLLAQVNGKTLVTKDGDTLLQSPNLGQILAEARDVYDSTSRSHYRNKMGRDYEGIRMTWILCGTSSLRTLDSSELGERFLDCVIMEGIDDDMEDEILWRVAQRVSRMTMMEDTEESQEDSAMLEAKALTGGYLNYLRDNIESLISGVARTPESLRQIIKLGKFVAYFRARPSLKQEETSEREFGARLVSQLTKLACCIAVVQQQVELNEEVMRKVTRIALDTARGVTMHIAQLLYDEGPFETGPLSSMVNQKEERVKTLLIFLKRIGVVESVTMRKGASRKVKWRLTEKIERLWKTVMVYPTDV